VTDIGPRGECAVGAEGWIALAAGVERDQLGPQVGPKDGTPVAPLDVLAACRAPEHAAAGAGEDATDRVSTTQVGRDYSAVAERRSRAPRLGDSEQEPAEYRAGTSAVNRHRRDNDGAVIEDHGMPRDGGGGRVLRSAWGLGIAADAERGGR
jgi:hypothetical protein